MHEQHEFTVMHKHRFTDNRYAWTARVRCNAQNKFTDMHNQHEFTKKQKQDEATERHEQQELNKMHKQHHFTETKKLKN